MAEQHGVARECDEATEEDSQILKLLVMEDFPLLSCRPHGLLTMKGITRDDRCLRTGERNV